MSKRKRTGKRPARPPLIDFDLDNAVFVDFETYGKGARDDRPVLVTVLDMRRLARADRERGVHAILRSGAVRTFVLHPDFVPAAREKRLGLLTPTAFARWLTKWQALRRPIAAFSSHDGKVLERQLDEPLRGYVNMLPYAKKWRWRTHRSAIDVFRRQVDGLPPDERAEARREFNGLLSFLRLGGVPIQRRYGRGETAKRLRKAQLQLVERGAYARLTPRAKAGWVQAVRHNRFDVASLAALAIAMDEDDRRAMKQSLQREGAH